MEAPNRNILWAKVFVNELARAGLKAVCIAPGSRSTPLALAFAEQPGITVYSHIDERGAAFFALGLALSSGNPAAVLCSSGTATANFYPAIVEAHYANVPLLVLTADRPPELRYSGANQTIDQVRMFGIHVLWSVDVALPESEPPSLAVRNLRTLADRAMATADGMVRGPVHMNFPFRKPLEPTPVERDLHAIDDERPEADPMTLVWHGLLAPRPEQISILGGTICEAQRGLIVCGPRTPHRYPQYAFFRHAVTRLAEASGFSLIADPLSGVRYGPNTENVLTGYDSYLSGAQPNELPDVILYFGRAVTSQALDDYLNANPEAVRWMISADGVWADPNHNLDYFLWADPVQVCIDVQAHLKVNGTANRARDHAWHDRLRAAERATRQIVSLAGVEAEEKVDDHSRYFDGMVVRDVVDNLPDGAQLFVANSLPVRHLDQFGLATTKTLRVFCNRGASGIDGTVSSALGMAAAHPELPSVLVTGDLALYHDLNGLLVAKRCGIKLIVVVINNDGGGLFHRLPIAEFDPPFTELFVTPHGLNFEPAARMFGLNYSLARNGSEFRSALAEALAAENGTVIEVPTDRNHDLQCRTELTKRIRNLEYQEER